MCSPAWAPVAGTTTEPLGTVTTWITCRPPVTGQGAGGRQGGHGLGGRDPPAACRRCPRRAGAASPAPSPTAGGHGQRMRHGGPRPVCARRKTGPQRLTAVWPWRSRRTHPRQCALPATTTCRCSPPLPVLPAPLLAPARDVGCRVVGCERHWRDRVPACSGGVAGLGSAGCGGGPRAGAATTRAGAAQRPLAAWPAWATPPGAARLPPGPAHSCTRVHTHKHTHAHWQRWDVLCTRILLWGVWLARPPPSWPAGPSCAPKASGRLQLGRSSRPRAPSRVPGPTPAPSWTTRSLIWSLAEQGCRRRTGHRRGETGLGWGGPGARQRRGPSPAHPATPATPAPAHGSAACRIVQPDTPQTPSRVVLPHACVCACVPCAWTSRDTPPRPRPRHHAPGRASAPAPAPGPRPGQWWAATLPSSGSHAPHCGPAPHRAETTSQAQGRTGVCLCQTGTGWAAQPGTGPRGGGARCTPQPTGGPSSDTAAGRRTAGHHGVSWGGIAVPDSECVQQLGQGRVNRGARRVPTGSKRWWEVQGPTGGRRGGECPPLAVRCRHGHPGAARQAVRWPGCCWVRWSVWAGAGGGGL